MAIAFRGVGNSGEGVWSNTGQPITPGLPTGWQPNDFAILGYGTHSINASPLVTEPSGWTLLGNGIASGIGGNVQLRLYWRRLQTGDSGPTLDDNDVNPISHHAWIGSWSGVSLAANPVDVFGTFQINANSGSTSNAQSVTPSAGNRTVLVCAANAALCTATSVSGTPAAVERADVENLDVPAGPESTCWEFTNDFNGSTGTGTRTVTWSQGGARVSVQMALRPATIHTPVAIIETALLTILRTALFPRALAVASPGVLTVGRGATFARAGSVASVAVPSVQRIRFSVVGVNVVAQGLLGAARLVTFARAAAVQSVGVVAVARVATFARTVAVTAVGLVSAIVAIIADALEVRFTQAFARTVAVGQKLSRTLSFVLRLVGRK